MRPASVPLDRTRLVSVPGGEHKLWYWINEELEMKDPGAAAALFIALGGLNNNRLAKRIDGVHWIDAEKTYYVYLTNDEVVCVPESQWISDVTKAHIALVASW
jgi:hypothetical protein